MPKLLCLHLSLVSVASVLLFATGCVNLDARDPSPFRLGQKTENGRTTATNAGMMKSPKKMQDFVNPTSMAGKMKKAWPFRRKTKMTIQDARIAEDDPTRLDNMPENLGPEIFVASARLAERSGHVDKAIEHYNTALSKDGRDRPALIGLARLQHKIGKTDAAIRVYRNALEVYRGDAVIMNDLGICYAQRKRLNESISMLQAATEAAPDREMYLNNLAAALVEANRTGEAMARLSRSRGPAMANYNMGYLLAKSGRKSEAATYLNQALKIDPNMQQARLLLDAQAPQVSSLPQRDLPQRKEPQRDLQSAPAQGDYQIPVSTGGQTLSSPEVFSRPASTTPPATVAPANAPTGPSYLDNRPARSGPFGYVPESNVDTVSVVSYVADVEQEAMASKLVPVDEVHLLSTELQQPSSPRAKTLVAPRPQH